MRYLKGSQRKAAIGATVMRYHGSRLTARGPWLTIHGRRPTAHGTRLQLQRTLASHIPRFHAYRESVCHSESFPETRTIRQNKTKYDAMQRRYFGNSRRYSCNNNIPSTTSLLTLTLTARPCLPYFGASEQMKCPASATSTDSTEAAP